MIFKWETAEERLLKLMNIPPKKKLEWLREMNELMAQVSSSKRKKSIRKKLRSMR